MSTKPAAASEAQSSAENASGTVARVFRAFSYRDFRLLWFGAFTSSAGTWLQQTAQSWLLFELTRDSFFLALDSFLMTAPILLFSLIGGVVADRVDRRRILLVSQVLQLSFAFTLAGMTAFGTPHRILAFGILTISFLTGCAQAFGGPAYQALVPMLVERRDLANAIALNSIQFNLARFVGPAINTIPFTLVPTAMMAAAVSFGINGLSFVAVMIALSALAVRHVPPEPDHTRNWRLELKTGLTFVRHREALVSLVLLSFASTFFGTQITTFLAVFAQNIFHTGGGGYSTLLSTSGAGAVAGALVIASLGELRHKGHLALVSLGISGLLIVAFSFSTSIWLAYPLVFLAGTSMMMGFALIQSLVQLLVTDAMRGRVMSIYMVAFRGGMPLGALVTGILARRFSISHIIAIEGLLLASLAFGFLISRSHIKDH